MNIDIKRITGETDRYNFHSHTQYCDGQASMEQMAKAAFEAGFKHWGFTPHSPTPFHTHCNMLQSDIPAYIAEAKRLKELYSGKMEIYTSLEIDYLSEQWSAKMPIFESLDLDYRLSSVHFVKSIDGEREADIACGPESFAQLMRTHYGNNLRYVVDEYFFRSKEMIQTGGFDILGHMDKIGLNASYIKPGIEQEPWYQRYIDDMIDLITATGIMVEVNTKAYQRYNWLSPGVATCKRLKSAGVTLVVNSDAHFPELVNAGREEALRLIG